MRPRSARGAGAFSLVEAALSLAIMSFAIFAIMGLFPVALQTAREGNRETRATLIARRIVDELQSLPGTNTALLRGPSVTNPGWRITGIDLSSPSVHVLTYDEQAEGLTNGDCARCLPESNFRGRRVFCCRGPGNSRFSVRGNFAGASDRRGARECAVLEEVSIRLCHVDEPALKARNGCLSFSVVANLFREKERRLPGRYRIVIAFHAPLL